MQQQPDNNLIQKLTNAGIEMKNFINDNSIAYLLGNQETFYQILEKFPYNNNAMNVMEAVNLDIDEAWEDDGHMNELRYNQDELIEGINNINNGDSIINVLIGQLLERLNEFNSEMAGGIFDGDDPNSAYTNELDQALKNMVAIYNVANLRVVAGGSKKSSKSAKKSRKSAKKSSKSAKKSRKSAKKSRKSAKKSHKSSKKSARKH